MGDVIFYVVLLGIVLVFWFGILLVIGVFVLGIFCVVVMGYLKENSWVKEDIVMGIVFFGMFVFGLVLFFCMDID